MSVTFGNMHVLPGKGPDDPDALVILVNPTKTGRRELVRARRGAFEVELPAESMATLVWKH